MGVGSQKTRIRYAQYIEDQHESFLQSVRDHRDVAIDDSPFADHTVVEVDTAFLGANLLSELPSLYDLFGKFMVGLDIEVLRTQLVESSVNTPALGKIITAESSSVLSQINNVSIPRVMAGSENINSVMSDIFDNGVDVLDDIRIKIGNKFEAELKYSMISAGNARWRKHLDWNVSVVEYYSEVISTLFAAKMDVGDNETAVAAQNKLWPFTVLDFEKAALGVLQGATSSIQESSVAGSSTFESILSGVLTGASGLSQAFGGGGGVPKIGGGK